MPSSLLPPPPLITTAAIDLVRSVMMLRVLLATLWLLAVPLAATADQTILGKQLQIKNPSTADKRKIVLKASEAASANTVVGDPTLNGATLSIEVDGGSASAQVFTLPIGNNLAGHPFWSGDAVKGFRYRDAQGENGPVGTLQIKKASNSNFQIKALARGTLGPISVLPPDDGIGGCAQLVINGGDSYSVLFGDGAIKNKGATLFSIINPTTEGTCTTTPTTCSAPEPFPTFPGPLAANVLYPNEFGVDVSNLNVDLCAIMGAVSLTRLTTDVAIIATEPRGVQGSPLTLSPAQVQQQNIAALAAAQYMQDEFDAAGYTSTFDNVAHGSGVTAPNVIADLPGTTCPGTVFTVGGHYDSENNTRGADDNASGAAGVLELARVFRAWPLPMTVRFVGFPFEEGGRLGSRQIAQQQLVSGTDVAGMLSVEMIGYTKAGNDAFLGIPNNFLISISRTEDPESIYLARVFAAAYYAYVSNFVSFGAVVDPLVVPEINGSDHLAWWERGFPAILAVDMAGFRNLNYHTANDTPATLDYGFLTNSTKAIAAGLAAFGSVDANNDGTPDVCQ